MTAMYPHLALPELLTRGHGQPGKPWWPKTFRRHLDGAPLGFSEQFPRIRPQNRAVVDTGALVQGCLAAAIAARTACRKQAAAGMVDAGSKRVVLLQGLREWWAKAQRMRARHRPSPETMQTAPQGAERVTYLAAVVNLLLAGVKLAAGILGNSAALVADAGHSLSDLFSDGVTLWAVKIANLPPDEDHPYGHGRFEAVGALCVSGLLIAAGGGIALDASQMLRVFACDRCVATAASIAKPGGLAFAACALSIVSKELLFRATDAVGRRLNSPVVRANALHHRSDVWSSVVALVGVVGSWWGITWFDPFAALLVAGMVLNMGVGVALDAMGQLTDTTDEAIVGSVRRAAQAVVGIGNVSTTRARAMGSHWLIDMEVVPDEFVLTASAADQLAARVRHAVLSEVGDAKECLVHVRTPATPLIGATDGQVVGLPTPREIDSSVRGALEAIPGIKAVTRTLAHFDANAASVEVLVEVPSGCTVSEGRQLAESARGAILGSQPNLASVQIHLALPSEKA